MQKVVSWTIAAVTACVGLVGVLRLESKYQRNRWSTFLRGDPYVGSQLFKERGCASCHAISGVGGQVARDLGLRPNSRPGLNQLVAEMWNHAPRMWQSIRDEKRGYPELDQEKMAHLFAYLYTVRYDDEPGDVERGRRLFSSMGCRNCHWLEGSGGQAGPALSSLGGIHTPIVWTRSMWNHAPAMEAEMSRQGLSWPRFQKGQMNDLLAYVGAVCAGPRADFRFLPADPDRGAKIFHQKSCDACHSLADKGSSIGPPLGSHQASLTIVQFAGLMWNHSPEMWKQMKARGIARPSFSGSEMADLIAFLYNFNYFVNAGSSKAGEARFAERGCATCHGASAQGTDVAPRLRADDETFTIVTFATALWRHGPAMYQQTQTKGVPWPNLVESDIADIVAFLNTPAR